MQTRRQEPIIIDLDDPTSRWYRLGAIAVTVLIVALALAPWLIDISPATEADASVREGQPGEYDPWCQPRLEIPSFIEPAASVALPSWMRLCDWFVEPGQRPIPLPDQRNVGPLQEE